MAVCGAMLLRLAQAGAGAVVLARLARGRSRLPPLAAARTTERVSVVIPARDEAERIGPCLAGIAADPDVLEVIVVDDGSADATAAGGDGRVGGGAGGGRSRARGRPLHRRGLGPSGDARDARLPLRARGRA